MDYPRRLLPQSNFKHISYHERLPEKYLLRHTPNADVMDEATGKIKPSCVAIQSDHLRDLSTNLLGVFCPEDRFFQIHGSRKDYFTGLWQPPETVDVPIFPDDFSLENERGIFFLKIGDVHGLEIGYNIGEQGGFSAVCKVIHTPVRCNFWHFSLRWFNLSGDIAEQQGSWKRRVLTAARALIAEVGRIELPEITPVDKELFTEMP